MKDKNNGRGRGGDPAHGQLQAKKNQQEAQADALSVHQTNLVSKIAIALKYAQNGLPVFLVGVNKKPLLSERQGGHGCLDATTDEAQIRAWWTAHPQANIGLAGGDGLVFIDVDAYKGANIDEWNLPTTRTVRTPSGGYHHYFFYDGLLPSRAEGQLAPGVCIKAAGGYVVAPGSRVNGKLYQWVDDQQPIVDLPERIAALIRGDDAKAPSPTYHPSSNGYRPSASGDDIAAYWLGRALEKTCNGAGDYTGLWLACQLLIEQKHGATFDVRGILSDYAERATLDPKDPFDERSVDRWMKSAAKTRLVQSGTPAYAQCAPRSTSRDTSSGGEPTEQSVSAEGAEVLPYKATPHGLTWYKSTRDGEVAIRLTNYTAKIIADIVEDDGAETRRQFEIEASLRGRTSRFTVPADRFAAMGWPVEHLGATAILYPNPTVKDHARTAIQLLSGDIPLRRTYTHTGWISLDSGAVYLHAGGAIGAEGAREDVSVALQGDLRGYELPAPPTQDALREAVQASLKVLELAPDAITFPLYAATWLPPVADVDTSLYLAGRTGAGKSELAALAQQHYGASMDARRLPANWSSSENALEAQMFLAKDALLVIDDFIPTGSTADIQRMHRAADRVFRAQGNRMGRQRMRADTSLRPAKPPRGMAMGTGEDIPRGHSLRGRVFIVEVEPDSLRWDLLTVCQANARNGLFAQAMAGYLQWLAGQQAVRRDSQLTILAKYRTDAFASTYHRRTPEIVAKLAYGLHTFLEFALDAGAISQDEEKKLWQRGWKALGETASQQAQHQDASDPTRRFLELVNAAITAQKANLATPTGNKPGTYEQLWGWGKRTISSGGVLEEVWEAHGERIGWLDEKNVYLEPTATYTLIQKMASAGGDSLGVTLQVLQKRLKERGLLASTDEPRQTNTIRRKCEGRQHSVLHFALATLSHYNPPDKPDIEAKSDGEEDTNSQEMSGSDVGKSGQSGNPTRHLTAAEADSFGPHASNVGFVGFRAITEGDHATARDLALADVNEMSDSSPLSTQNPTSEPDIIAESSRRLTFEERVKAYVQQGMREDDAIRRCLKENANRVRQASSA